jgi:ribosomal protein L22
MKAYLKNYRMSPRKVRLVADAVKNKNVQVADVQVNQGMTLKRWRARARGAAFPINKRTSNISVELAEKAEKKTAQKKEETKKVETKAAKKPATKKTAQKETK